MINRKKILVFFLFIQCNIYSQQLSLYSQGTLLHNSILQPAIIHDEGISLNFPSYSMTYYNSAFSPKDLIDGGEYNANISEIVKDLSANDLFIFREQLTPISLSIQRKNLNLSFSLNQRLDFNFIYPDKAIQLLWLGNEPYIGEDIKIDNIDFDYTSRFEYHFGLSYTLLGDKLTLGVKAKFINGLQNASVEYFNGLFETDSSVTNYFQLTSTADYLINTSNIVPISENLHRMLGTLNYYSITNNRGYGFDLGIKAKMGEKLQINASILDIGKINWNTNLVNYESNIDILYNGFTFDLNQDETEGFFIDLLDSLKNEFNPIESSNSYTTTLVPSIYSSISYLHRKSEIGILFNRINFTTPLTSLGLYYKFPIREKAYLNIQYMYVGKVYNNIGVSLVYNLDPIMFYIMTDNLYSLLNVNTLKYSSGVVGVSLNLIKKD